MAVPTHVNHMSLRTENTEFVRSPPTLPNGSLKLRRDRRNRHQALLSRQQFARKCTTLRQVHFDFSFFFLFSYTTHALTAKSIRGRSLPVFHLIVEKNATNTIRG